MTARAQVDLFRDTDPQLQAAIIRQCALGEDAVAKIRRAQQLLSVHFNDAAIRLGYATQDDIDSAARSRAGTGRMLPRNQPEPRAELVIAHQPNHPHSEKIRSLRTELLLRHESIHTANVIAIVSPCRGEGRSQLAAELAISFAQLDRPTLLVDADMRHPKQHILFKADNTRGLSQAGERAQAPPFQAIAKLPALAVLTAGPPSPQPLERLSDRHFEAMVNEWQRNFEFVVLDTPPIKDYADGLAIATIAGRVLSLSRAGHTTYSDTRDMMRRLAATQSRMLGAVLNYF